MIERFFGNGEIYAVKITDENPKPSNAAIPHRRRGTTWPCIVSRNPRGGQLKPSRANFVTASSERSMGIVPTAAFAGGICF